MENKEDAIRKYIDEKKKLQKLVLQIIEKTLNIDDAMEFQKLITFLDTHKYEGNKAELKHFLNLILNIATNHHRQPNFFQKIEKILTTTSKFYKPIFSNDELFTIFQQSKPILLFLINTKIITIDEVIIKNLLTFTETNEDEIYYYFYPELKQIIKSGIKYDDIHKIKFNEDIENFEINRQKYENNSILCSIIREDLIDDFIQYYHKTNISLESEIKRSVFETNSMFIQKEPTLIEYAAFFGSIQILKYLEINDVKLTPSLWLYAVHSENAEIISFLEEKQIEMHDRTFSEAVKCHHNSIALYIYENYFDSSISLKDLNDVSIMSVYSSENYEFFSYEIDGNIIFYCLCKYEYSYIVDLYLSIHENKINKYINQITIIHKLIFFFNEIQKYSFF